MKQILDLTYEQAAAILFIVLMGVVGLGIKMEFDRAGQLQTEREQRADELIARVKVVEIKQWVADHLNNPQTGKTFSDGMAEGLAENLHTAKLLQSLTEYSNAPLLLRGQRVDTIIQALTDLLIDPKSERPNIDMIERLHKIIK